MFEGLQALPADPILGLSLAYQMDTNPLKVDLGVGVYKDEDGHTTVLESIRAAQQRLHQSETTKSYQGPAGNPQFNELLQGLIFGQNSRQWSRIKTLQTPGGCGALRLAAELIVATKPEATIWVSDPTWANHIPLLGSAGLNIKVYPYYNAETQGLKRDEMMAALATVPKGDLVLLHGCCHNPCGTDLSKDDWAHIATLALENGFTPFVDLAYQGFGEGLEEDAYGVRLLADQLPELIVASSCSKNFALYRERTGALSVMGTSEASASCVFTHMQNIARGIYSMPPAHGASLVALVLSDSHLNAQWQNEVTAMRERIHQLRHDLAAALTPYDDFNFIARQQGMFSFLGLNEMQVARLQKDFSIYMVGSSRINLAGINQKNLPYLAQSIGAVL